MFIRNILFSCIVFSNTYAFDRNDLMEIWKEAELDKIAFEHLKEWKAIQKDDGIHLKVLVDDKEESVLEYFCRHTADEYECKKEYNGSAFEIFNDERIATEMQRGQQAAFSKLEKTLKRSKKNYDWINVAVTKSQVRNKRNHFYGLNIWVAFNYVLDDVDNSVCLRCHIHPDGEFFCHYKTIDKCTLSLVF